MTNYPSQKYLFSNEDFENRKSKGKKIIDEFFKEHLRDEKISKNLIDLYALSEAKRYVCVNYNSSLFKNLSKEKRQKAIIFNNKLEQSLKNYINSLLHR